MKGPLGIKMCFNIFFFFPDHKFFFAKMNIMNIFVLDYFGGAAKVDINEYFSAAMP